VDSLAGLQRFGKNKIMSRFIFIFLSLFVACTALGELPPSVYETMQSEAPEHLQIQVLRVDIEPGEKEFTQEILIMATVEKVLRTSSGVKLGDLINISYQLEDRPPGWVGPGQVPILAQGDTHVAYLKKLEKPETYAPAAGAMSFHNF